MVEAGSEDLLLLAILEGDAESPPERTGATLSSVVDLVGGSAGRLSKQIELAGKLEDLRADGLVETESGDEGTLFVLTETGERRATAVRDRLADRPVDVVDRDDGPTTVREVAAEFDGSVAEVLADLDGDGAYYRDSPPGDAFVDREGILDRFHAVLGDVEDGRGRVWFLSGSPGVGKTALAERLAGIARDHEYDVASARARPDDPYGAVRDVLAAFEEPSPLEEEWVSADDPETYRTQQTALFAELADALAPGPTDPPRVVVLDDLHRADPATAAFLGRFLERFPSIGVVLVCCFRPDELPDGSPVAPDAVPETLPGDRLRLSPFDREHTAELVVNVVDARDPPAEFVDAIHEWTGGNPLFVEEVTVSLLDSGQLAPDFEWYPTDLEEVDAEGAVVDTVEERIAGLDEPARRLLRWVALVGEPAPVDVLQAVTSFDPVGCQTLLALLVDAGVLDWSDDQRTVTFRSALVRESVLDGYDSDDRRERHRAIARAFERTIEAADTPLDRNRAVDVARHRQRGGDERGAMTWYQRASERMRSVYANESATEYLREALAVADGTGDDATLEICERLADTHLALGEFDEAERYVTLVHQRTTDDERRQRMALYTSRIANARGDYQEAVSSAKEWIERERASGRVLCQLLDERAMAERRLSDEEAAIETARELKDLATESGEWDMVARALRHLGVVAWRRGEYDRASERHLEAVEVLENHDVDDPRLEALIRNNLGVFARYLGDYGRAIAHCEAAIETFERIGDRRHQALSSSNLARSHWHRGEYDRAEELYETAVGVCRKIGARHEATMSAVGLAQVAVDRGEYGKAEGILQSVADGPEVEDDGRVKGLFEQVHGRLELAKGRPDAARDRLESALEAFEDVEDDHNRARTLRSLGRVALERGDHERGAKLLRRSIEGCRELGDDHGVARGRLLLGRLERERTTESPTSDGGEVDRLLGSALETFRAVEDQHRTALARLERGRLAMQEDDPETARDRLRTAVNDLVSVGDTGGLAEALRTLVTACQEAGADEVALQWCDRGIELLDAAGPGDGRREWFVDRRAAIRSTDDA